MVLPLSSARLPLVISIFVLGTSGIGQQVNFSIVPAGKSGVTGNAIVARIVEGSELLRLLR